MATRSLIGIKLDNDIIKTIYCHWDGYPSNNGKMLITRYTAPHEVFELIDGGDLSSLHWDVDRCIPKSCDWTMREPRDVEWGELAEVASNYGVEYVYIYNDECEWDCYEYCWTSGTLHQIDILTYEV